MARSQVRDKDSVLLRCDDRPGGFSGSRGREGPIALTGIPTASTMVADQDTTHLCVNVGAACRAPGSRAWLQGGDSVDVEGA